MVNRREKEEKSQPEVQVIIVGKRRIVRLMRWKDYVEIKTYFRPSDRPSIYPAQKGLTSLSRGVLLGREKL